MAIDSLNPSPDIAASSADAGLRPDPRAAADEVLHIDDLHVSVHDGGATALRGVSLRVRPGEIVGLVGESGSGKTLTCRAALGVLPPGCAVEQGRFRSQPRIPLYFGGSSEAAYRVGGKHADVYALWGEPLAETAEQIASVRAAAAAPGRSVPPRISVSFRPILGPTEELAWDRAHQILQTTRANIESFRGQWRWPTGGPGGNGPQNRGSQRLLAAAAKGELHDRALWTPLAAATGAGGNSTALVGTPDTVAQALLDYVGIGVTTLLIRGYDPYDDAIDYGRYLLPLVRDEIARRERRELAAVAAADAGGAAGQATARTPEGQPS